MAKSGKKVLKEVMFEEEELIKEEPTPEPQLLKEESGKMTKDEFLKSIGLQDRPGSIRAIEAWEKYSKE
tara:strand:- start:66 stop:272 length:207 start_codon:yes stop_codon:yes gene_type:complete